MGGVPMHEHSHLAAYLITSITSFFTGGGMVRTLTYVSKRLPPLPKDAGWWAQLAYSLVGGTSGLDPNSTITPPWDGKTDRRGNRPTND